MADSILRTINYNKAVPVLGLLSISLLIQLGGAFEFTVGGSQGWTTPSDPSAPHYNQWAEKNRFQIGDTLVFVYNPDEDSVLWVSQADYTNCTIAKPIEKYTDGHTVFKLKQSGPHYFISGVEDRCMKNEKIVVVVMADRSNQSSPASPPTPATVPSPAPSGEGSPPPPASPPPTSTLDVNPAPAPEAESPPPPPNSASSITSFIFSIGAFIGSSLFLVL